MALQPVAPSVLRTEPICAAAAIQLAAGWRPGSAAAAASLLLPPLRGALVQFFLYGSQRLPALSGCVYRPAAPSMAVLLQTSAGKLLHRRSSSRGIYPGDRSFDRDQIDIAASPKEGPVWSCCAPLVMQRRPLVLPLQCLTLASHHTVRTSLTGDCKPACSSYRRTMAKPEAGAAKKRKRQAEEEPKDGLELRLAAYGAHASSCNTSGGSYCTHAAHEGCRPCFKH